MTSAKKSKKSKRKSKPRKSKRLWIQEALRNHKKGALHLQLHVPLSKTIPLGLLHEAEKKSGLLGKRARLAATLRNLRKRRAKKRAKK